VVGVYGYSVLPARLFSRPIASLKSLVQQLGLHYLVIIVSIMGETIPFPEVPEKDA